MNSARNYIFGRKYFSFTPETEYQAVLTAAVTLGYTLPTQKEMFFQNEIVKALKTSGIWSKLDQFYLWYHSAGFDFSNINWIHPSFILTRSGSLAMSFINKEGARLSGPSGSYFIGNYNSQTESGNFQLGNASFGWVNGLTTNLDGGYSAVRSSGNNQVWFRQQANRQYFQQGEGYTNGVMVPNAADKTNRFFITTRNSSNNRIFDNGTKVRDRSITYFGTAGVTSSTNVNYTFNFGSKGGNNTETLRMAFTGSNLTDTECTDFTTIWNNYINSI